MVSPNARCVSLGCARTVIRARGLCPSHYEMARMRGDFGPRRFDSRRAVNTCSLCSREKPTSEFAYDGKRSYCKSCWNAEHRIGGRFAPNQRLRVEANLRRNYGITLAEFEARATEQNHRCAICRRKKRLVVDHDHETGHVRGLLCSSCNLAIGLLSESLELTERLVVYLGGGRVSS